MTKKFKIEGEWYLPTSPDKRFHGTLNFDPVNGTEIIIYGDIIPVGIADITDIDVLFGLSSDNKKITITRLQLKSRNRRILGDINYKHPLSFTARYTLVGIHCQQLQDNIYFSLTAEIANLRQWLNFETFERPEWNPEYYSLKFRPITPINFQISDNIFGGFSTELRPFTLPISPREANVEQVTKFTMQFQDTCNLSNGLKELKKFLRFLYLGLYQYTYAESISLKYWDDHSKSIGEVLVYYNITMVKRNVKEVDYYNMLFHYQLVKNDFEILYRNWHSNYPKIEPVLNLLSINFYSEYFNSNTFLNLAQAAETLHTRLFKKNKISDEDFKDIIAFVCKLLKTDLLVEWFRQKFEFSNQLNFKERIEDLVARFTTTSLISIYTMDFAKDVKNTRNYFTHYSVGSESLALKGRDLFYLNEKLKLLITASLLGLIEMSEDNREELFKNFVPQRYGLLPESS